MLTLSGVLSDASVEGGTIEVNGVAAKLEQVGAGFSQPILINSGENWVKVVCFGRTRDGVKVAGVDSIRILGDFSRLDLFTQLRWNDDVSDVDFHLLPPESGIDDLWTTKDCYYSNSTTDWGAALDVDDVNGRGPEHITVPNVDVAGSYTLYIHYFGRKGAVSTDAYATVGVRNGALQGFGPMPLTRDGGDRSGDVWEVCKISFPSGQIQPVMRKVVLTNTAKRNQERAAKH